MMGATGERRSESAARRIAPAFDPVRAREDFPILRQRVHGRPLVYLDNAATTQKPRAVIDAVSRYYEEDNANVHRGVHLLSERATRRYEEARVTVARFIGAADPHEVIFVRGTTEAVNLVAQTFGRTRVGAGRRGARHRARAPLQHRALAAPLPGEGGAPAGGPDHGRGRPRSRRARARSSGRAPGSSP